MVDSTNAGSTGASDPVNTMASAIDTSYTGLYSALEGILTNIPKPVDLSPYATTTALNSSQSTLNSAITQEISDRKAAITQEQQDRANAIGASETNAANTYAKKTDLGSYLTTSDAASTYVDKGDFNNAVNPLQTSVSNLQSNLANNYPTTSTVNSDIAAEQTAREKADSDLATQIQNEAAARDAAIKALTDPNSPELSGYATKTYVDNSVSKAVAGITEPDLTPYAKSADVTSQLNTESQARQSEDQNLQSQITQEIADRKSAITAATPDLSPYAKSSDLTTAESNLNTAISNETTARKAAIAAIQMPDLSPYAKSADVESELGQYAKTSDVNSDLANYAKSTDVTTQISNAQSTVSLQVSQEQTRAEAAEGKLISGTANLADKGVAGKSLNTDANGNIVYTDGNGTASQLAKSTDVSNAIKNATPDLSGYAKSSDLTSALQPYAKSADVASQITQEQQARENAATNLQSAITAETQRAQASEAAAISGSANLPSGGSAGKSINSDANGNIVYQDAAGKSSTLAKSGDVTSAVSTETQRAAGVEGNLQTAINNEASARAAAITQEQKDRDAAIKAAQPDLSPYAKSADVTSQLSNLESSLSQTIVAGNNQLAAAIKQISDKLASQNSSSSSSGSGTGSSTSGSGTSGSTSGR